MKATKPNTIHEYIAEFPKDIQVILEEIRATIKKAAPEAEETIKYGMPTFTLNGNLVHFGAFKKHIGFYPVPRNVEAFEEDLALYKGEKATAQFPLNKPMPLDLISRIVVHNVKENLHRQIRNNLPE